MTRPLALAAAAALAALLAAPPATAAPPPLADSARYTLDEPADGWERPGFDDSDWKQGPGGFGTPGTDGARVATLWSTDEIWLRKSFALDAIPDRPALLISHDEDAVVYLNGTRVAEFEGYVTEYKTVPLSQQAAGALKVGENLLAVHCRQSTGGQFIDVHLVDADSVPDLPDPPPQTEPIKTDLITEWGAEVTPGNAWTKYPRPQMRRDRWTNLNGNWEYAVAPLAAAAMPAEADGEILVPFCLESKLSGVSRLLNPDESLWYRRTFDAEPTGGERTLLHFEAVDYICDAFVNGTHVGRHVGGSTPFSFDVTDALKDGEDELILRVEDSTGEYQLRGKQRLQPGAIFYTRVSGVWGTVWTETVPAHALSELKIDTDAAKGSIAVSADVFGGERYGQQIRVTVRDGDETVGAETGRMTGVFLTVPDANLWSPGSPHLYDLTVELLDHDGAVTDMVESYAGIRTVGTATDADGHPRFTLNGKPAFHLGPLDQGWWPDGLLTPPSDEAMKWEIDWLKSAGFNMIRKHIKVEPRRYYYHCDRAGMLVWQDQPSGWPQPPWTQLHPNPTDADWPAPAHAQYMAELEEMVAALENHPSIVCWVPFNESWGQHRTVEVGDWLSRRDPSRLVNVASGGNWWPSGDIVDMHHYPEPNFPFELDGGRFDGYVKVIGEYGGHGLRVPGHEWNPDGRTFSYGDLPEEQDELRRRYERSAEGLLALKAKGISGGVLTQTTDVEGEINGLLTYDRKVVKIPAEVLADLHRPLVEPAAE